MKLIVGLGNPGVEYKQTRHNIGYMVVDRILEKMKLQLNKEKFEGEFVKTNDFIISKPITYMNNSGSFVSKISEFYEINPNDILIIHDEIDLEFGKVVVKTQGGANGQKGVRDIVEKLKSGDFPRIKVGIGRDTNIAKHVLSNFSAIEKQILKEIIDKCAEAAISFIFNDIRFAINIFNE